MFNSRQSRNRFIPAYVMLFQCNFHLLPSTFEKAELKKHVRFVLQDNVDIWFDPSGSPRLVFQTSEKIDVAKLRKWFDMQPYQNVVPKISKSEETNKIFVRIEDGQITAAIDKLGYLFHQKKCDGGRVTEKCSLGNSCFKLTLDVQWGHILRVCERLWILENKKLEVVPWFECFEEDAVSEMNQKVGHDPAPAMKIPDKKSCGDISVPGGEIDETFGRSPLSSVNISSESKSSTAQDNNSSRKLDGRNLTANCLFSSSTFGQFLYCLKFEEILKEAYPSINIQISDDFSEACLSGPRKETQMLLNMLNEEDFEITNTEKDMVSFFSTRDEYNLDDFQKYFKDENYSLHLKEFKKDIEMSVLEDGNKRIKLTKFIFNTFETTILWIPAKQEKKYNEWMHENKDFFQCLNCLTSYSGPNKMTLFGGRVQAVKDKVTNFIKSNSQQASPADKKDSQQKAYENEKECSRFKNVSKEEERYLKKCSFLEIREIERTCDISISFTNAGSIKFAAENNASLDKAFEKTSELLKSLSDKEVILPMGCPGQGLREFLFSDEGKILCDEIAKEHSCLVWPHEESKTKRSADVLRRIYKPTIITSQDWHGFRVHIVQEHIDETKVNFCIHLCDPRTDKRKVGWAIDNLQKDNLKEKLAEAVQRLKKCDVPHAAFCVSAELSIPAHIIAKTFKDVFVENFDSQVGTQKIEVYMCAYGNEALVGAFLDELTPHRYLPDRNSWDVIACEDDKTKYCVSKNKDVQVEVVNNAAQPFREAKKRVVCFPVLPSFELHTCPLVHEVTKRRELAKCLEMLEDELYPNQAKICPDLKMGDTDVAIYRTQEWGFNASKAIKYSLDNCIKEALKDNNKIVYIVVPEMQGTQKYPDYYLAQKMFSSLRELMSCEKWRSLKVIKFVVKDFTLKQAFNFELNNMWSKKSDAQNKKFPGVGVNTRGDTVMISIYGVEYNARKMAVEDFVSRIKKRLEKNTWSCSIAPECSERIKNLHYQLKNVHYKIENCTQPGINVNQETLARKSQKPNHGNVIQMTSLVLKALTDKELQNAKQVIISKVGQGNITLQKQGNNQSRQEPPKGSFIWAYESGNKSSGFTRLKDDDDEAMEKAFKSKKECTVRNIFASFKQMTLYFDSKKPHRMFRSEKLMARNTDLWVQTQEGKKNLRLKESCDEFNNVKSKLTANFSNDTSPHQELLVNTIFKIASETLSNRFEEKKCQMMRDRSLYQTVQMWQRIDTKDCHWIAIYGCQLPFCKMSQAVQGHKIPVAKEIKDCITQDDIQNKISINLVLCKVHLSNVEKDGNNSYMMVLSDAQILPEYLIDFKIERKS